MKNKIIKIIKSFFYKEELITEDEYYENLFVKNKLWNTKEPNTEEIERWNVIENMVKTISYEDLNILDLGCGRGWLSNLLSKYGKVTGIEPVENVVKHAKKLFPNINFISGVAEDLINTNTNFYDLIVSSEVYEHIEDELKDDFIKNINSLLKSNGSVIISTPRKEVEIIWHKHLGANQPIEDWVTEKDLEEKFNNNGFVTESISRISYNLNENESIELYQVWHFKKS